MRYSINVGFFTDKQKLSLKKSLELISKIGFEAIDYTTDLRLPDCLEKAKADRELIEKYGLYATQTHAPYNRYGEWGEQEYTQALENAYEVTKILGAKYLVVHGDEFDFGADTYTPEKALIYNYEL